MELRLVAEKEGKNTEKKNMDDLALTTSEGRIEQIRIVISSYQSNNSLCMGNFDQFRKRKRNLRQLQRISAEVQESDPI